MNSSYLTAFPASLCWDSTVCMGHLHRVKTPIRLTTTSLNTLILKQCNMHNWRCAMQRGTVTVLQFACLERLCYKSMWLPGYSDEGPSILVMEEEGKL